MTTEVAFVSLIEGQISIISVHDCTDEQRSERLRSYAVDYVKKAGSCDTLDDCKNIIDHTGLVLVWGDVTKNTIEVHSVIETKETGWIRARVVKSSKLVAVFGSRDISDCLTSLKDRALAVTTAEQVNMVEQTKALKDMVTLLEEDSILLRFSLDEAEKIIVSENLSDERLKYENQILVDTIDGDYETILTLRDEIKELQRQIDSRAHAYDHVPAHVPMRARVNQPNAQHTALVESAYDKLVKQIKCFNRQNLRNAHNSDERI